MELSTRSQLRRSTILQTLSVCRMGRTKSIVLEVILEITELA